MKKNTDFSVLIFDGGGIGIRTLAPSYEPMSFPSPPLRPLGYSSVRFRRKRNYRGVVLTFQQCF